MGWRHGRNQVQLIIADESERLRPTALELQRDRYDRDNIALILIGMPGLEKQFNRYPQFYSRVGFAHQYRPLGQEELLFVLQRHWRSLGRTLDREIEVREPPFLGVSGSPVENQIQPWNGGRVSMWAGILAAAPLPLPPDFDPGPGLSASLEQRWPRRSRQAAGRSLLGDRLPSDLGA